MKLAERLTRLGTETAFAVSVEANRFAERGNKVYPFHLGDINLPTPENVQEAAFRALQDGKNGYCPNAGIPELREALAEDISKTHGLTYGMENVALQPGGKPTIGKFILALMNPGDEVLYPSPGYPIYESMIEFHGGTALPYGYQEGKDNFQIDIEQIQRSITAKTRLLILNDLQNPLGAEASEKEFKLLAELVRKHDLYVLCDEAYFEIRYEGTSKSFAAWPGMQERCVLLYTFSKKFAMTGWRLGATIGPKQLIDIIIKLNTNAESCPNHFIQYGAIEGLRGDQSGPQEILRVLKERRDKTVELLNSIEGIRCYCPRATFYLFPNVTAVMKHKGFETYNKFRIDALEKTGVSFCTRLHFGRERPGEAEKYLRFAYSGIDLSDLEEGLTRFKKYVAG